MMTETPAYNLYQLALNRYLKARARDAYDEAIKAIDDAIEHCPIAEALPTLERMRKDTLALMPRAWDWSRLWRDLTGKKAKETA